MVEHQASVVVAAPVEQVFAMFTHFNDFPKFMRFVKEVTYHDEQNSHWVTEVVGRHEWDAVNESWLANRQIGWRSREGLENAGRVTFQPQGPNQTLVTAYITYNPPGGPLGELGEMSGAGKRFERELERDLQNFAQMVTEAPPGALDPNASNYIFHSASAAARSETTDAQNETMSG